MTNIIRHIALPLAIVALIACVFCACMERCSKTTFAGSTTEIILFNGTGTSPNDVAALEDILKDNQLNYATINSAQLNGMNHNQLQKHRLLIIPGGNFIDMGNSLTRATVTNIRDAVHGGLNYLGICAGAFLAGGSDHYRCLNLTQGVTFVFYGAENQGIRKAPVAISSPGAPTLDQYWEDGPQLTGWGEINAKYPDGTPAVVQGTFGSGRIILTGVHAEAPNNWRGGMTFRTSAATDNAYALLLIRAAINRVDLAHY